MNIASTPKPPYYAVIFTSLRTETGHSEYERIGERMVELAKDQDGFLGIETVRNGLGITVSYWRDEASIRRWYEHAEHSIAREMGRKEWYKAFKTRVALVERDYGMGTEE